MQENTRCTPEQLKAAAEQVGIKNPITTYEFMEKYGATENETRGAVYRTKKKNTYATIKKSLVFDEQLVLAKLKAIRAKKVASELPGMSDAPKTEETSGRTEQLLQAIIEQNNKILDGIQNLWEICHFELGVLPGMVNYLYKSIGGKGDLIRWEGVPNLPQADDAAKAHPAAGPQDGDGEAGKEV